MYCLVNHRLCKQKKVSFTRIAYVSHSALILKILRHSVINSTLPLYEINFPGKKKVPLDCVKCLSDHVIGM